MTSVSLVRKIVDDAGIADGHRAGWTGSLDKLERHLLERQRTT